MTKLSQRSKRQQHISPIALLIVVLISVASWLATEYRTATTSALPENVIAEVQVLDVGQGSSLLLRTVSGDDERSVLIDAGERSASQAVCAALDAAGIKRLDLVILTHPHIDHYGGSIEVLNNYKVDELWMPVVPESLVPTNSSFEHLLDAIEDNGCKMVQPVQPRTVELGDDVTLRLLNAFLPNPESLNDTSLCVRIDAKQVSFLVTGDGEMAVEDALREGKEPIDVDILVAGHHGSNTSSKQYFLNAVSPHVSVISCGRDNSYNLPNEKVLTRLSAFGAVYRTDLNETVSFSTDGDTVWVTADNINDVIDIRR